MRNKLLSDYYSTIPEEVKVFARYHGDMIVLINQILKRKGLSKKQLAENLGKEPSEISKWLNGEHNLTLKSLAKLEVELGEPLIVIPTQRQFISSQNESLSFTIHNVRNTFEKEAFTRQDFQVNKPLLNVG